MAPLRGAARFKMCRRGGPPQERGVTRVAAGLKTDGATGVAAGLKTDDATGVVVAPRGQRIGMAAGWLGEP